MPQSTRLPCNHFIGQDRAPFTRIAHVFLATLIVTVVVGCIADEGAAVENDRVQESAKPLVSGKPAKDTALYLSSGEATMYQWAAREAPVLRVIPAESIVRVGNAVPRKGFYQVIHAGTWGWVLGAEMTEAHSPIAELSHRRVEALRLAQSAMGFSYWWSNARWQLTGPTILPTTNRGDCNGTCPDKCTHSATGDVEYGADCSGFVSTIWGVGGKEADTDPDTNPTNNGFATKAFAKANSRWASIDLEDAITGDAVVRHDDTTKHIFLVGARISAGMLLTYECVGCETGCRTQVRREVDLSAWTAIRRSGWPAT